MRSGHNGLWNDIEASAARGDCILIIHQVFTDTIRTDTSSLDMLNKPKPHLPCQLKRFRTYVPKHQDGDLANNGDEKARNAVYMDRAPASSADLGERFQG